jgi:hypothetical protein
MEAKISRSFVRFVIRAKQSDKTKGIDKAARHHFGVPWM